MPITYLEHLQWCSVWDPPKIFFTSKFSYRLILATPPIKVKTRIANRWETTNSKPLGPIIIMMRQSETQSNNSQIIFITLFSAGAHPCLLRLLPATAKCGIVLSQNQTIFLTQPSSMFWLFFIQFYCADHILSTAGEALLLSDQGEPAPSGNIYIYIYTLHISWVEASPKLELDELG